MSLPLRILHPSVSIRLFGWIAFLSSLWCIANASRCAASIVGASTSQNAKNELSLMEVQFSGGRDPVGIANMVGLSSVFHFGPAPGAPSIRTLTSPPSSASLEVNQRHKVLTDDAAINTGFASVGLGLGLPAGPITNLPVEGLGVTFSKPVLNGPLTDIILCDLSNGSVGTTLDAFYVSGISNGESFGPALICSSLFSISFNGFPMPGHPTSPSVYNQSPLVATLADVQSFELTSPTVAGFFPYSLNFYEIELSSLGLLEGDVVTGLFIQSAIGSSSLDPTFIAGLYSAPEPGGLALMLWALVGVAGRRRFLRGRVSG